MLKKCCCCALAGLALAGRLTLVGAAEDDHDHDHDHGHEEDHGPSCACEAKRLGFDIVCSDQERMLQAIGILQDSSNDCATDCSSDVCYMNYLIVQSHHDFCLHDEVPGPLEDGIHFYENACADCSIQRKPDPDLLACPIVPCTTGDGNDAYQNLLSGGCLPGCSADGCADNYRILRAAHDTCPEDTLDQIAEQGIHDYEEACEMHNCNPGVVDEAELLHCHDDHGDDDHDTSYAMSLKSPSATTSAVLLSVFLVGAVAAAA